ncbi:hypothetical protein PMIN06_010823 [Paraphaeosphaeria minitans]
MSCLPREAGEQRRAMLRCHRSRRRYQRLPLVSPLVSSCLACPKPACPASTGTCAARWGGTLLQFSPVILADPSIPSGFFASDACAFDEGEQPQPPQKKKKEGREEKKTPARTTMKIIKRSRRLCKHTLWQHGRSDESFSDACSEA